MSIESQAIFYYRNVCNYNPVIKTVFNLTASNIEGFNQFSNLLRTIYNDWRAYETSTAKSIRTKIGIMTDDLENYHNLTYTLDFLYAIAVIGKLQYEDGKKYLRVNKATFKTAYKKSAAFSFEILEKYSFYFGFYKDEKEVKEYKFCEEFCVYYKKGHELIEAIKLLAQFVTQREPIKQMPGNLAFMLADYQYILSGEINTNPLQESIINTLGAASILWQKVVTVLQNECDLTADMSFNHYVFPNRTITFKKNKKTICKFGINIDRLNVRLPLSYEMAKEIIEKRKYMPQSINDNINEFHCVHCGKCENNSNIKTFEGVSLCTLNYSNFITEDSRCIRIDIKNEEEASAVCDIIKKLLM